ncbi:MAG: ribbon-helix-helix protein, CopG family [Fimbriimonadaceae bacterium]|nr:ribbon-helix-helix protein, CopG family [Fimbriimonadaceae bacterium]
MKRMQILLPDALYAKLKRKAQEQEQSMTELIRNFAERELEAMEGSRMPNLPTRRMGVPKVSDAELRDFANDRGL